MSDTFDLDTLKAIVEKVQSAPTIAPVPCRICGKGLYLVRVGGGYMTSTDNDFTPPICDECRGVKEPPCDVRATDGCSYVARIRRLSDGVERDSTHQFYKSGDYGSVLWWAEGNASCDCNRDIFFVGGGDEEEDSSCGHERYLVQLRYPDGEIFYDEFADGRRE